MDALSCALRLKAVVSNLTITNSINITNLSFYNYFNCLILMYFIKVDKDFIEALFPIMSITMHSRQQNDQDMKLL